MHVDITCIHLEIINSKCELHRKQYSKIIEYQNSGRHFDNVMSLWKRLIIAFIGIWMQQSVRACLMWAVLSSSSFLADVVDTSLSLSYQSLFAMNFT